MSDEFFISFDLLTACRLARWVNAPTTGLDLVKQNIVRNHAGIERGPWILSVKSYRSHLNDPRYHTPTFQVAERTLCCLTMGSHVFALLEDPGAPTRGDYTHMLSQGQAAQATAESSAQGTSTGQNPASDSGGNGRVQIPEPLHYRSTFVTVTPPGALEALITQLGAPWQSSRHVPSAGPRPQGSFMSTSQQLSIDGSVFSIGTDWLIRVGNVILTGGTMKGMLLEVRHCTR